MSGYGFSLARGDRRDGLLANITAFKNILLDWDVWRTAQPEVCPSMQGAENTGCHGFDQ